MSTNETESPRPLRLLDDLALGLLLGHLLIRLFVSCGVASPGTNLLIHMMVWPALSIWALRRFLEGGLAVRLTGIEIGILIWCGACILSLRQAPYKFPAIETAAAFVSLAALVPALIHLAGPERRGDVARLMRAATLGIAVYALLQPLLILPMERASAEGQRILSSRDPEIMELAIRLRSNEPWGTFFYPNSLAGFLVLMIPWLAGALRDARATGPRLARAIALLAALAAISLTGSKGGWVALLAACGAGAVLLIAQRHPLRRRAILAGGLAVAVALGATGWIVTTRSMKSMQVRAAYGEAAIKAAARSPLIGIGLANFEDAYLQHKGEVQEETRKVHNDYLQVLCELGIIGLLAFASMLAWGLHWAIRPESSPAPSLPFSSATMIIAGLVAGCGTLVFSSSILLPATVGILALLFWQADRGEAGPFSRIGLAAGFMGLLVHLAVDFDLYDYGVAAALFTALGVLALHALPGDAVPTRKGVAAIGALVPLLIAIPIALGAARFEAAERLMQESRYSFSSGSRPTLEEACRANPIDPEPWVALTRVHRSAWAQKADWIADTKGDSKGLEEIEALWFAAWEQAIALRPDHSPYHYLHAIDRERVGRPLVAGSKDRPQSTLHSSMAQDHLLRAEEEYRRAVELYPTRALTRAALAAFLAKSGRIEEATLHARAALKYSAMAGDNPRLKLQEWAQRDMERLTQ